MTRRASLALALAAGLLVPSAWAQDAPLVDPGAARGQVAAAGVSPQWWQAFGDARLSQLVAQAMSGDADLAAAAARVTQARAEYRLARAQASPRIEADISGGRARTLVLGRGVDAWAAQPQVTIGYDLDLFAGQANTRAAGLSNLLASQADRDAVALAVASTAAEGYIQLLGLDAQLEVARQTIAARAEELAIARRRVAAGYGSGLDLFEAQAQYDAAARLVPALEQAVAHQENGLRLLLGEGPGVLPRGGGLDALRAPALPGDLPAQALRRRPDVFAAEQRLVAADRTLDASRAALWPQVSLTGSTGLALSSALDHPVGLFSIGAGLLDPILDRGRLKARRDGAAGRREEAAALYRKTALSALRETADALVAMDRLDAQAGVLASQVAALEGAERLAARRYAEGYSGNLDVLDARRALLAARLELIEARTQALAARVTLYQALGGGWGEDEF